MPTINDVRQQYPQYGDLSDAQLADALYSKFYSDMPREQFDNSIGLAQQSKQTGVSAIDYAKDTALSGGVGLAKGIIGLAGLPGDLRSAASQLGGWLSSKMPNIPQDAESLKYAKKYGSRGDLGSGVLDLPTSAEIRAPIENVTGEFYKPKTSVGNYAETVGEFVPASIVGPGAMPAKLMAAAAGGIGSEVAGQLTKGTSAEPYARVAGGVIGGVTPALAARAVTPNVISAERKQFVDTLRANGITPTAGQATGSESLRYAESALGNAPISGGKASAVEAKNLEALTSAAISKTGENASRASPDVINAMTSRIGNQFEGLSARNVLSADQPMVNDLITTAQKYVDRTIPNMRPSGKHNIEGIITGIVDDMKLNGGIMPGELYQATRSKLGDMANAARQSDTNLSYAIKGIQKALDGAMERSIGRTNPGDLGAWQNAREQYKNMLVIKDAVASSGANAAEGLITPLQLRSAVARQNKDAYVKGKGDLADLARAAAVIMQPLPQSGTAPRAAAMAIPAALGAGTGAVLGPGGAGLGAMIGSAAGAATPGMVGRVLMSAPMQAYLQNQVMAGVPVGEAVRRAALFSATVPALQSRQ